MLSLSVLGLVALAAVAVLGWNLSGGRLYAMETPSMCPVVCVGALVADQPLQGPVHVGELVTFHPPDTPNETYTHEISHIFANGMIQTRGVANPSHDPWLISRSDIVGQAVFNVRGLGWLLKALPLLAVGVLAWVLVRQWVARRLRRAWDRVWMTALVVIPLQAFHPLVRATVMSILLAGNHLVRTTVVNTGMLSVSFRTATSQAASVVRPGAVVHLIGPPSQNSYLVLREAVSFCRWGWAIVGLIVISPLAGYLWHIWRNDEIIHEVGVTQNPTQAALEAPATEDSPALKPSSGGADAIPVAPPLPAGSLVSPRGAGPQRVHAPARRLARPRPAYEGARAIPQIR
jgi:hypothetical protein